ncbi:MAG: DUF5777 family beta-barrel protein [bacterium]
MHVGQTLYRLSVIVLLLASSTHAGDEKNSGKGSPFKFEFVRPPESSSSPSVAPDDLQNQVLDILDSKCAFAGCHTGVNAPRGLDLSEEVFVAKLVKVKSADYSRMMLVKPGDAANSYLIKKVRGTPGIKGDRMPRGLPPLSAGEVATLEKWINAMPADVRVEVPEMKYAQPFYGWSLANLPTAETLEPGAFTYRIAHRFRSNAGKSTFETLWGIDGGSYVMAQFAFPVSNNLTLNVERTGVNATFEFGAKWRFLREKTDGSMPLSAAIYAGVDWTTISGIADPANPNNTLSRTDGERFSYFAQLPITKHVVDRISLAFVPGVLLNGNFNLTNEDPLVTMGVGGKFAFNKSYALFAEVAPVVSGDATANVVGGMQVQGNQLVFYDTFVAGLEIKAGGHVFHWFIANSGGNTTNQYMSGGDLDFGDGNYRIGFNIYRVLDYPFVK